MRPKPQVIQALSAVLLGGVVQGCLASPLEGVCRTDANTLQSIRADSDQTLWNFMLSVCGEKLSASVLSQPVSIQAPHYPEVSIANEPMDDLVKKGANGSQHPIVLQALASQEPKVAPSDQISVVSLGESGSASEAAELVMPPTTPKADESAIASRPHVSAEVETAVAPSRRAHNIYELLGTVSPDQVNEILPAPLEYEPSRFSRYRSDPFSDWSASNQGRGYLKKPSVMEAVPYGFYVGTSVASSLPVDGSSRSEFPSLIVGYSDERAIRDFGNFHGVGFRLEGEVVRSRSKEVGMVSTRDNVYSVMGEVYQPLGAGFFWGLGASYGAVRNVLVQEIGQQAVGEFDGNGYAIYIPMGLGFVTPGGRSGKLQLDLLVASRTKAKWTPLSGATLSDLTVKRGFARSIGLEVTYVPFPKFEPFLRYEWTDKSKPYDFTLNGVVVSDRAPVSRGLEMGLRYYW